MAYIGTQANLNTTYAVRHTANTYGEMPTTQAGSPTSVEAGGDGRFFSTRDEVSAGNKIDRSSRAIFELTNDNWASASAIKDMHGKVTTGGGKTTHTFVKTTGGTASSSSDDNANDAWATTRGGTATNNTHNTLGYK